MAGSNNKEEIGFNVDLKTLLTIIGMIIGLSVSHTTTSSRITANETKIEYIIKTTDRLGPAVDKLDKSVLQLSMAINALNEKSSNGRSITPLNKQLNDGYSAIDDTLKTEISFKIPPKNNKNNEFALNK